MIISKMSDNSPINDIREYIQTTIYNFIDSIYEDIVILKIDCDDNILNLLLQNQ